MQMCEYIFKCIDVALHLGSGCPANSSAFRKENFIYSQNLELESFWDKLFILSADCIPPLKTHPTCKLVQHPYAVRLQAAPGQAESVLLLTEAPASCIWQDLCKCLLNG